MLDKIKILVFKVLIFDQATFCVYQNMVFLNKKGLSRYLHNVWKIHPHLTREWYKSELKGAKQLKGSEIKKRYLLNELELKLLG